LRTFIGEILLPEASKFRRNIKLWEKLSDLLPVERSYILTPAMEEDLLDKPTPLPGVGKIEFLLRPDDVALYLHLIISCTSFASYCLR